MTYSSMQNLYASLQPVIKKIFVIPLINFENKSSDYLYLLYKDYLENNKGASVQIESLSVFAHPRFFFERLFNKNILVHYHWFEINDVQSLLGIFWKTFWLILYKMIGGKLVWTIHNKNPHLGNYKSLNNIFRKTMAHLADKLHVHCSEAVNIMSKIFNVDQKKFLILEHPRFPAQIIDRETAIRELVKSYPGVRINSSDKIFLMFGNIAEYKGLNEIIEIFNGLSGSHKLIIAGTVKKGSEAYFNELEKNIVKKDSIFVIGKRIPDKDIPSFFCSADFALFNYKEILTSGVVYLALSYNKKIITSPKGCLKELSGENIIFFDKQNPLKNILQQI